jgi:hypothetical protein
VKSKGTTNYSSRISGNRTNHGRAARFDITDGYVGIQEYEKDGKTVANRVLLTPDQWEILVEFVKDNS